MAIVRRQPGPGVIHHSDQRAHYACGEYVDELERHGFLMSLARTGNPYEDAMMEGFVKILKHKELYLREYQTFATWEPGFPISPLRSIIRRGFSQSLATAHRMTSRD